MIITCYLLLVTIGMELYHGFVFVVPRGPRGGSHVLRLTRGVECSHLRQSVRHACFVLDTSNTAMSSAYATIVLSLLAILYIYYQNFYLYRQNKVTRNIKLIIITDLNQIYFQYSRGVKVIGTKTKER